MQTEELRKRQERAAREPLIIARAEDGFRVYSPARPTTIYIVRGDVEAPTCSCPDFERHRSDPAWRSREVILSAGAIVCVAAIWLYFTG